MATGGRSTGNGRAWHWQQAGTAMATGGHSAGNGRAQHWQQAGTAMATGGRGEETVDVRMPTADATMGGRQGRRPT